MNRKLLIAVLLGGTAMTSPQTALAQVGTPTEDRLDSSDAAADAAIQSAATVDDLRARIELLTAQVEALQRSANGAGDVLDGVVLELLPQAQHLGVGHGDPSLSAGWGDTIHDAMLHVAARKTTAGSHTNP